MPLTAGISRRSTLTFIGAAIAAWVLPDELSAKGPSANRQPSTHPIDIRKFAFSPSELTIVAGDSVEWINHDFAPHTATEINGAWDSGEIQSGQPASVQFAAAGRHEYFCGYHPHMNGRITVLAASR